MRICFNRRELAGSLGDLGTLLPIAAGMVLVNGLNPLGLFFVVGLFYVVSGLYFRVTVPVQPMKVIGAYAIATSVGPEEISASVALMAMALLVIGATNAIGVVARYTPKAVIRGVQVATGTLLIAEGVRFMVGSSRFQELRNAAEPFLSVQSVAGLPLGLVVGVAGGVLTLLFLENRRVPAGLLVILFGLLLGVTIGTREGFGQLVPGIHVPRFLPFGLPGRVDLTFALFALVIPQLPMTLGNAVVANADLSGSISGTIPERSPAGLYASAWVWQTP